MSSHDVAPVAATLAVVAGTLIGQRLGAGPGHLMALASLIALVVALASPTRWLRRVGIAICLCACGAAVMQRALNGSARHSLTAAVARGAAVELRGELVGDPSPSKFETTALLRVSVASVSGGEWQRVDRVLVVHARARSRGPLSVLDAADHLYLRGDLLPLRGFDERMRWKHAVAAVDLYEVVAIGEPSAPWKFANRLRSIVQRGIDRMPIDDRGLLNGFLLGDTRGIDDALKSEFRAAGLSHLLAVSGANVAFVLSLAAPLLMRSRIGVRVGLGCCIVVLFGAMTRFEPSVLRASCMALVTLGAQLAGRSVSALRALSYAVGTLLVIDPFLVRSVAFQLSASACLGIALCSKSLAARVPGPAMVQQAVGVSIAAQIGVTPVLMATFGGVGWVSPAANLFAVPLAEPITVVGLPLAVIASMWRPAAVLLLPVGWALQSISAVARVATAAPVLLIVAAALTIALGATVSRTRAAIDQPVDSSP